MDPYVFVLSIYLGLLQVVSAQSHGPPSVITSGFNAPYIPGHTNGIGPGINPNGLQGNHGMGSGMNIPIGNQGGLNMPMLNQGLGMAPLGQQGMQLGPQGMQMGSQGMQLGQQGMQLNGQMPFGKANAYPPAAYPEGYGGSGNGDVAVAGELGVAGTTLVNGQVPITGSVQFGGSLPAGGTVTISGMCGCGCNGNNPNIPPYGSNPYY